jgi:Tropinone reductase 1
MNTENRWNLKGKKAVVTGASKGIGKAVAEELLSLGAEVLCVARGAEELDKSVAEWLARNLPAYRVAADVSTVEGRESVFAEIENQFGGLDILVNNVGTNVRKPTLEYTDEEYAGLWQTNVTSAFAMTRSAYPFLKASEAAGIVNVASVAGIVSVGTGTIYGMTKAALIQFTRGLAVEWGKDDIRVNAVAPWFTETPLTESLLAQEPVRQAIVARTPLGRIAAPEDVAGIIAFLCLPAASYITGQCVAADGGFLAKGF